MKLPRIVYLGYRDLRVSKSGSMLTNDYGHFDPEKGTIVISTGKGPIEEANTVIHELLHACLKQSSDPIIEDETKEERLVTVLANQMTELWRRNPDLITYLNARLGERA